MKPITLASTSRISAVIVLAMVVWAPHPAVGAWQLVWSDEFLQADGSSPDATKWGYDLGNGSGGWGNNELEYYTSRTNNARIQNGQLVIEAKQESFGGKNYTSARMLTKGKWSWAYGRMEANIKLPRGQGIWPAFWTLGTNIDSVSWPACGEIDIMENIGKTNNNEQGKIYGTIHGPQSGGDYNGGAGVGGGYTLPGGAAYADSFHVFAVEWTTNQIKWYMDGNQYFTATPASLPGGGTWPFTQPQFILLNVAVGGNWPGYPSNYTVFPQQMLVDYVRVYKYVAAPPSPPTGLAVSAGNAKAFLSWDDSNSGATGYNVKRATNSGGPYTTIAGPATNSYTDAGVSSCATYYYVVSATNSAGESANSTESSLALGAFALAVNSGGGAVGPFVADASFAGGTQAAPVTSTIDTSGLAAPAPQAVYQTERYGNFIYTFTGLIPGTSYNVRLHFAETYWTGIGQRRFNIFINGNQVLTNFDIIAAAGAPNKATIQEFLVPANGVGQMVIQYTTVTDNAKASGMEILLPRPAAPAVANNSPIFAGMSLNLTASPVSGASYSWTGPNGFASTNQNPTLANVTTNAGGLYFVTAAVGNCASAPSATSVAINPPATVSITSVGSNITITWPGGTLQSATNLTGPWRDLNGTNSPYVLQTNGLQQFYRIKLQ